jgi:hypothetical protein
MVELFEDKELLPYDIISVQEPWLNENEELYTMYHPLKRLYNLVYQSRKETRVSLFVSKRLPETAWTARYLNQDLCSIEIRGDQIIHVFNVYRD